MIHLADGNKALCGKSGEPIALEIREVDCPACIFKLHNMPYSDEPVKENKKSLLETNVKYKLTKTAVTFGEVITINQRS